ncbi:glutamate cysteine ligase regulatory subunit [Holotrichia oblita]|uniref:Glutamate cysteine ligase regulatory subunit n=1 Tax=Holotrichia oblita TaxID=644536 RepID=A0ACB9TL95_HOLOL|nr:glutamate cysteine ligase regulatory subunit [Holotrichia oblita]
MENILSSSKTVLINTGNILALNDLTKNPGQNPTEELKEAINITLKDFKNLERTDFKPDPYLVISRQHDDLTSKMSEHELADLKIGLKVFVNSDNEVYLTEALDKAFTVLNVSSVQNVIVSYNHLIPQNDHIGKLQNIWKVLEMYTKNKKIGQIGLADLEEGMFRAIYEWADVKPSIIQINLATCCVVPPTLQAFCKDNEVQLLTHSDPPGKDLYSDSLKIM